MNSRNVPQEERISRTYEHDRATPKRTDQLSFQESLEFLAAIHRHKVSGWAAGAEGAASRALQELRHDHAERVQDSLLKQSNPITPECLKRAIDREKPSAADEAMYRVIDMVPYELLQVRSASVNGRVFHPESPWLTSQTCSWRMERPNCSCEPCAYRDAIGSLGAWRAAFEWVKFHTPDGKRIPKSTGL